MAVLAVGATYAATRIPGSDGVIHTCVDAKGTEQSGGSSSSANNPFRVKWGPRAYKVGWGRQALGATRAISVYKVSKEKSVRPVLRVNRVSKVK